jgi:hypothetical protein
LELASGVLEPSCGGWQGGGSLVGLLGSGLAGLWGRSLVASGRWPGRQMGSCLEGLQEGGPVGLWGGGLAERQVCGARVRQTCGTVAWWSSSPAGLSGGGLVVQQAAAWQADGVEAQ